MDAEAGTCTSIINDVKVVRVRMDAIGNGKLRKEGKGMWKLKYLCQVWKQNVLFNFKRNLLWSKTTSSFNVYILPLRMLLSTKRTWFRKQIVSLR